MQVRRKVYVYYLFMYVHNGALKDDMIGLFSIKKFWETTSGQFSIK